MRLVSTIITPKLKLGFILFLGCLTASAQENSPFSRYGIGNIFPGQHVVNRGIGGVSAAYRDALGQSVNFYNPASYSSISLVTYDIGIGIDNKVLRSAEPLKKFSSTNFSPSYVVLGMPLSKKRNMGLVFGLRPISKINYSVVVNTRIPGIDSVGTLYEGEGGLNQGFVGIAKRWGGLSIGVNGGFSFGRKETDTRVILLNDSVNYNYANSAVVTSFTNFSLMGGLQYQFKTGTNSLVRLGVTGKMKETLKASQDIVKETFFFDANGTVTRLDSALQISDRKGTIQLPGTFTTGIAFETRTKEDLSRTLISAEYESTKWSEYRFYDQPDRLVDNWQVRFGAQLSPDYFKAQSFWSRVTYRTGFFYSKDYINADNNELKVYGITLGAGFPVMKRNNYSYQYSNIHTALEFGRRGSKVNNITESFFRFSVGFSLSDRWFIPKKYD
jgi:hypothetical protein